MGRCIDVLIRIAAGALSCAFAWFVLKEKHPVAILLWIVLGSLIVDRIIRAVERRIKKSDEEED
jgi:predicted membrane channel-forming protein YqfA (hemolysin III family)